MRSTFFGIETMRRAILTQRRVMDTIGHNVANAATEGYSRQRVTLATTRPFPYPGLNKLWGAGQIGTGVVTAQIERIRDQFIDKQIRIGTTNQGRTEVEKNTLSQVENAFLEPSTEQGFSSTVTAFFAAWQELSKRPDNTAARNQVVSTANSAIDVINHVDQTLREIRIDLNGQLKKDVAEVNRILHEIAYLNPEIAKVFTMGDMPNDLLDKRDLLLDELAKYVNYNVIDSEYEGGIAIAIGGRELLRNDTVYDLTYDMAWDHPSQNTKTPYMNDVSQNDFYMLSQFSSGELRGVINARDNILTGVQTQFGDLVSTFVNSVNNVHSAGLGISLEDMGSFTPTLSDITNMNNYVEIAAADTRYFSEGDLLQIEDADGESIIVKITDIDILTAGNGRLFFDNVGVLNKAETDGLGGYNLIPFSGNGIDTGATIRKVGIEKNNFFVVSDILNKNLIGDTNPDHFSQMTSAIALPDYVTLKTTVGELEKILGIDITDNINGLRLNLDNKAFTRPITENTTLDRVFALINAEYPIANGGQPLTIRLDEVNHRIILSGTERDALSQIGGANGSDNPLFRILGFEGYGIAGFKLPDGTQLSSTLEDLGISDGYIQIDNVVIEIDKTVNLQSALDNINAALNQNAAQKSYGTKVFFDAAAGRVRIVSSHQFAVSTPLSTQFPAAGGSVTTSNLLTTLGFQRSADLPTYSQKQTLASGTTSDIGARISVNPNLLNDINRIAAALSYAGVPGDNANALDIAGIKNQFLLGDTSEGRMSNPTLTMDDFYNNTISEIGVQSQKAIIDSEVNDSFLEYYQNRRQEVSGVSLDEEMTKMIESQQAFNAASRMINTIDEMLDRIINGTGLAGR